MLTVKKLQIAAGRCRARRHFRINPYETASFFSFAGQNAPRGFSFLTKILHSALGDRVFAPGRIRLVADGPLTGKGDSPA